MAQQDDATRLVQIFDLLAPDQRDAVLSFEVDDLNLLPFAQFIGPRGSSGHDDLVNQGSERVREMRHGSASGSLGNNHVAR